MVHQWSVSESHQNACWMKEFLLKRDTQLNLERPFLLRGSKARFDFGCET